MKPLQNLKDPCNGEKKESDKSSCLRVGVSKNTLKCKTFFVLIFNIEGVFGKRGSNGEKGGVGSKCNAHTGNYKCLLFVFRLLSKSFETISV